MERDDSEATGAGRRTQGGRPPVPVLPSVAKATWKLWPLLLFLFCAKLYVNLRDDEPFSFADDLLLALSAPAILAGVFFGVLSLTLKIGVAVEQRKLDRTRE